MYSGEYGVRGVTLSVHLQGSIPTVVRLTFQLARCGYTKSNTTNIIFT
jgi:hypothetical protein